MAPSHAILNLAAGAARMLRPRHLLIVCYHGLRSDHAPEDWLLVSVRDFRRQLEWLSAHYRMLPLTEGVERLAAGALPGPSACITFDDGYRNNLTLGLPVLRQLKISATVFLTTSLIGSAHSIWTVEVDHQVVASTSPSLELPDGTRVTLPAAHEERVAIARRVKDACKAMPHAERRQYLQQLAAEAGVRAAVPAAFQMLTWPEVTALQEGGLVSIGAHTATHEILSTLPNQAVEEEIRGSIEAVQSQPNVAPVFAYPNGRPQDFDERSIAILRHLGVRAALTTTAGVNQSPSDAYRLRRVLVGGGTSIARFMGLATVPELSRQS